VTNDISYFLNYLLTPCSRVLLEKLTVPQLVQKFSAYLAPEGSLLYSQVPATYPYPEPSRPSPFPLQTHLLKIHFNIILPSTPGSPRWSLSFRFPHQNPVYVSLLPIRATYPAHLILLDLITRSILGEWMSLSSSLCSFLQFLVSSLLLGPNILL